MDLFELAVELTEAASEEISDKTDKAAEELFSVEFSVCSGADNTLRRDDVMMAGV